MANISESDITCPHLREALDRAERDALDKSKSAPSNLICEEEYVQHLSMVEKLTGSGTCEECGKVISIILHLRQVKAFDGNTNKLIKVYSLNLPEEKIAVSGHRCVRE